MAANTDFSINNVPVNYTPPTPAQIAAAPKINGQMKPAIPGQGYNPDPQDNGDPSAFPPGLINMLNPDGSLKSTYSVNPIPQLQHTQNDINSLSAYANNTGPSPWLNLQNQSIDNYQNNYLDQANQAAQNNLLSSWDALAANGGLDSGAQERLAAKNNLARINAQQGIFNQGFQAHNAAGLQDASQKFGVLQNLPGMQQSLDNSVLGVQQGNMKTALGGVQSYNQGVGAAATSDAIANGGGGGGGGGAYITKLLSSIFGTG